MINFAKLKLKLCNPDKKQLRIKMNKLVEAIFETDSVTEAYHKLFVDMAIHGRNSNVKIISELLDVIETQNEALRIYEGESIETDEGYCYFADNAVIQTELKLKLLMNGV